MPVSQNRHAPLTSVATSAADSHQDLSYHDDSKRPSISSTNLQQSSPSRPYSPGMRSLSSPKVPNVDEAVITPGEIQMQSFADGSPPPPPPSHSWKKIERWVEKHYPELLDNLCEGCSQNDVNELEHELDMTLPQDVRESLSIHDGQERGGRPTGIIFSCMLLDCEEIVQEWNQWKVVNEEYLSGARKPTPHYPLKSLNSTGSSSSSQQQSGTNKLWRQELLDRQDSQPPKAIQKAYAHPSWIPLARDWGGNNIAVDLAPGPMGKWGQIIIFGRDYDCKYVIARSWSHFLAVVADDLSTDRVVIDEESGEMKLKEFKTENVEPGYLDILRWRADQKYGRKGPAKGRQPPPGLNTNVNGVNGRGSPYGSPVPGEERGRSPNRFSRPGTGSPRHTIGSPLARVQEENAQPQAVRPGGDYVKDFADIAQQINGNGKGKESEKLVDAPTPIETNTKAIEKNKLVDMPTPISSRGKFPSSGLSRVSTDSEGREPMSKPLPARINSDRVEGLGVNGVEDEMKNVTI
jgi:cell wall assembly regulator SMI1